MSAAPQWIVAALGLALIVAAQAVSNRVQEMQAREVAVMAIRDLGAVRWVLP